MHQIKHSNTSRLSLHFKVLSQSYKSFPTSPIRNTAHGSIISSTNITISAKGGRFYPIDLSGKPETAITTLRCEEQTGRAGSRTNVTVKKLQKDQTAPEPEQLTRQTQVMQGLSVMLGMCRTSPSLSQLAGVPVKDGGKVTQVR